MVYCGVDPGGGMMARTTALMFVFVAVASKMRSNSRPVIIMMRQFQARDIREREGWGFRICLFSSGEKKPIGRGPPLLTPPTSLFHNKATIKN